MHILRKSQAGWVINHGETLPPTGWYSLSSALIIQIMVTLKVSFTGFSQVIHIGLSKY